MCDLIEDPEDKEMTSRSACGTLIIALLSEVRCREYWPDVLTNELGPSPCSD